MASKHTVRLFDMQFITSCISTTMVLILLGLMVFFVLTAQSLSVYVKENLTLSVLLSSDAPESSILKFQKQLNKEPFVRTSTYISKEQALKENDQAMGTDQAEFLGYNPFQPSLELNLSSDYANSDSVKWIKERILQNKLVTEVDYPENLMDSVNSNLRKVSIVLLALAALLTLVSFALINNTIRLTIYSKRYLIHTMKLVGASWGFIRRPFLARNVWIGVISGLLANVALTGGAYALLQFEPELAAIVTPEALLWVMCATLAFGVVIAYLCAYISINRYLRMSAGDLYA